LHNNLIVPAFFPFEMALPWVLILFFRLHFGGPALIHTPGASCLILIPFFWAVRLNDVGHFNSFGSLVSSDATALREQVFLFFFLPQRAIFSSG